MSSNEYTPASIIAILNNSINIKEFQRQITIKGIYKKTASIANDKGYYWDNLLDPVESKNISLCVHQKIRNQLEDGKSYIFTGYFNRYIWNDGKIATNITLINDSFSDLGFYYTEEDKKGYDLRNKKANEGHKNLDLLLEEKLYNNIKPHIAIITGNASKALGDIFSTIKNVKHAYNIKIFHINITSKNEIIKALNELEQKNFDIVLLTRGGGSNIDLDIFNDREIAETALNLDSIFVTSIGHADDKSLLQDISDRDFISPTLFGTFLDNAYKKVINRKNYEQSLQIQLQTQELEFKRQKKISIVLFIIGIILGLILNKIF